MTGPDWKGKSAFMAKIIGALLFPTMRPIVEMHKLVDSQDWQNCVVVVFEMLGAANQDSIALGHYTLLITGSWEGWIGYRPNLRLFAQSGFSPDSNLHFDSPSLLPLHQTIVPWDSISQKRKKKKVRKNFWEQTFSQDTLSTLENRTLFVLNDRTNFFTRLTIPLLL